MAKRHTRYKAMGRTLRRKKNRDKNKKKAKK